MSLHFHERVIEANQPVDKEIVRRQARASTLVVGNEVHCLCTDVPDSNHIRPPVLPETARTCHHHRAFARAAHAPQILSVQKGLILLLFLFSCRSADTACVIYEHCFADCLFFLLATKHLTGRSFVCCVLCRFPQGWSSVCPR